MPTVFLFLKDKEQHQHKTGSALLALFLLWGSVLLVLLLSGCSSEPEFVAHRFSGPTMGTRYNITLVSQPHTVVDLERIRGEVNQRLEAYNQIMSTYIPDSELSRLNDNLSSDWLSVSAELYRVIQASLALSEMSGGAFDVTLGPLIDLWGFGAGSSSEDSVPSDNAIAAALSDFGYQYVELDSEQLGVRKHKPVRIDLSAIAKGYGADIISDYLLEEGFNNHLVEIGGEMKLVGHSQRGTPWRIGIESPLAGLSQQAQRAMTISDRGLATSGDYRNYFEVDGQRYSHTLDSRTGRPITHNLASVTVLHPTAGMADGLATAFNVLGAQEALKLANREGIAALFIVKGTDGFQEIPSEAFQPYIER